jgi:methionine-rich copper-binding protein CopC
VSLNTRAAGQYTVKYRVLSVDGHIVDSRLTFTVKGQRP